MFKSICKFSTFDKSFGFWRKFINQFLGSEEDFPFFSNSVVNCRPTRKVVWTIFVKGILFQVIEKNEFLAKNRTPSGAVAVHSSSVILSYNIFGLYVLEVCANKIIL